MSGYFITKVLMEKYNHSTTSFYINRVRKIFPLYLGTILFLLILYFVFDSKSITGLKYLGVCKNNFQDAFIPIFLNLIVIFQDVLFYFNYNPLEGAYQFTSHIFQTKAPDVKGYLFLLNPPSWSLAIEGMFYLIAPIIVKLKRSMILMILTLSLLIRGLTYYIIGIEDPFTYRFFPSEVAIFLIGTLAYHIRNHKSLQPYYDKLNPTLVLIFIILLFVMGGYVFTNEVIILLTLVLFGFLITPIVKNMPENAVDKLFSKMSYPLFICHFPMIYLLKDLKIHAPMAVIAFSLLISLVIAVVPQKLRYRFFQKK
jgi:peptidoglycan/LPS O-acetylase OafA/YrhL